ncbi:MAG: hypothetical protein ACT4N4_03930 [Rhodospirillales bacterium]
MTAIYIKCHSRAAYLDRCIRSIKRNVAGHGPIVLLNDGVQRRCLDRLLTQHPGLEIRDSLKVTDPPADPAALEGPKYDPAKFWVAEIAKDTDGYITLIEEDAWFVQEFDLPLVLRNLAPNGAMMLRFSWNNMARLAADKDTIFRAVLGAAVTLRYYSPTISQPSQAYMVFALANGIYRRDYWLHCYRDAAHWTAERDILKRALMFLQQRQSAKEPVRFCDFGREAVHTSFYSTGRIDSGGHGVAHKIDQRACNAALDDAWLAGELDPMADYPGDIGDAARMAAFKGRLTQQQIDDWAKWRADYVAMYRRLGADIS